MSCFQLVYMYNGNLEALWYSSKYAFLTIYGKIGLFLPSRLFKANKKATTRKALHIHFQGGIINYFYTIKDYIGDNVVIVVWIIYAVSEFYHQKYLQVNILIQSQDMAKKRFITFVAINLPSWIRSWPKLYSVLHLVWGTISVKKL